MLDKHTQLLRVVRHLLWLSQQPSFYGSIEIQFQDSVPIYTSRQQGRRIHELQEEEMTATLEANALLSEAKKE